MFGLYIKIYAFDEYIIIFVYFETLIIINMFFFFFKTNEYNLGWVYRGGNILEENKNERKESMPIYIENMH